MPTPGKASVRAGLWLPRVADPWGSREGWGGGLEAQQSWPYGEPQGREGPGPTWSGKRSLSSVLAEPVSRRLAAAFSLLGRGGAVGGPQNGVPTFPGGSSSSSIVGTHPSFPGGRWPRPGLRGARPARVTQPRHTPGTSWARREAGRGAGVRPQTPGQVVWGPWPSLVPLRAPVFGSRSLSPGRDRSGLRRGLLSAGVGGRARGPWEAGKPWGLALNDTCEGQSRLALKLVICVARARCY